MSYIYKETVKNEKSGSFIKQFIYYENGKYTFSCFPIATIDKLSGNMIFDEPTERNQYDVLIHTCERKSKKQDIIAIEKARLFYEDNK